MSNSSGDRVRRVVAALVASAVVFSSVAAGAAPIAADDVGDTLATARSLGGTATASFDGTFDRAADIDVFRFTGAPPGDWSLVLVTSGDTAHPALELVDRDGVVIQATTATSGRTATLSGDFLGYTGVFFVRAYGAVGTYRLTLNLSVGLLRVVTSPPVPAVIRVSVNTADQWSVNWRTVPAGNQLICFLEVTGYSEPPCAQPDVAVGGTTVVTGVYRPRGWLRVQTDPPVASTIRVDGIARNDWGMWTDVDQGQYEVCFGGVVGFDPPPCQVVLVRAGTTTNVVGTFTADAAAQGEQGYGMLRVVTSPAVPAQIILDDQIADSWSLNWVKVKPGRHTVCFRRVAGYAFRPCIIEEVTAGATTTVTADFRKLGTLRVLTDPPLPSTIIIDGSRRNNWGFWSEIDTDLPEVCFGDIAGLVVPPCQTVYVPPGQTTTVVGTFTTPTG